jgi:uncharacterized protein
MPRPLSSPRTIRWSAWDRGDAGLEHLELRPENNVLRVSGVVVGSVDGEAFGLDYRLTVDEAWHVREALVSTASGQTLRLDGDGRGAWRVNGRAEPSLQGCIDIDLQATPFTNTLPIRRLPLETGQRETISVVYLNVPSLEIERLKQRYTALEAGRLYRFEGLDTGFQADLPVDADGLVLDYPDLFRRLPGASHA